MKTIQTILSLLIASTLATTTASAATIFVRASAAPGGNGATWPTAYNDLAVALAAAAPGDEVWVARGTYVTSTTGSRSARFFLRSGVKIRGGFAGTETALAQRPADPDLFTANPATDTILTGEIATPIIDDNAFNVVEIELGSNAQTMLERVVVTRASNQGSIGAGIRADSSAAVIERVLVTDNASAQGAAMWANNSTGLVVRDSAITSNRTTMDGAGLFFSGGTATIERITFRDNRAGQVGFAGAGGGLVSTAATLNARDCIFEQNQAIYGGGLYADSNATFDRCIIRNNIAFSPPDPTGASRGFAGGIYTDVGPTFRDCDIIENTGVNAGGLANQGVGATTFLRCRFIRNTASGGGGAGNLGAQGASFINCLFDGNSSGAAGPCLHLRTFPKPASATLINCTSVNHLAPSLTPNLNGAIYNAGSLVVLNSILWNPAPEFSGNLPGVGWSNIEGFSGGLANISADPKFVNPASGDYRLMPTSPCIDAGRNDQLPLDVLDDLDSLPRFRDDPATTDTGVGAPPLVDMGAYEFQPAPPPCIGDADGSRTVNFTDITSVLANFGTTYNPTGPGDADRNGTVNFTDITTVLANFGTTCP